ncbi:MAG: hypothetical protein JSW61_02980 [Candidatus Thorarchaeota archaeon]|nr:MAG: hypothetical protein JSW61_02980 [Candidatus Thorarchaeota archaeon]
MTEADELRSKFENAVKDFSLMSPTQQGEGITRVLHQNDWIRILVTMSANREERESTIEVELSVPCSSTEDCDSRYTDTDLICGMSLHLNYLADLNEAGFDLEIIKTDSIWTVSAEISEAPDSNLFRLLVPP